jgi:GH25 family lysozyme M1 (1,4-beta-N-acetylmuramidase)
MALAAALIAAGGSLAFVGLSGRPAVASQPQTTTAFHVNHFNVGAAHSPQLLRQLAGPAATSGTSSGTVTAATPLSNAVQGIDVASGQEGQSGGINWSTIANDGIRFAAIKATEGDYYTNGYALNDLAAAKAAGLSVVAYAFAIPNGDGASASAVTQADDIINYLKSGPAGVPPIMLDIEYDPYKGSDGTNDCYGLSQSAMLTWIEKFTAEVQSKTGQPAIIYTAQNWWSECVGTVPSPSPFASNPLWVAAYTDKTSPGTLPSGWSSGAWTYWQYTDTGTVRGISGYVDRDQLNPNMLTLLNPGDQQDPANGGPITAVQLHSSQDISQSSSVVYSAPAGGLPAGLSVSSKGLITGNASSTPGNSPVTIQVTDASGTRSVTFTWFWTGTLSVTSPGTLTTGGGSPVSLQLQASDSPSDLPVTFSAPRWTSGHRLPLGLSISPSGKITGWADRAQTYQVTVYAADAGESAGSVSFTWTVSVAPDTGPTGLVHLDLGGKCLDDPKDSSATGTVADIQACLSTASQDWTYAQDDSLRINGLCLQSQPAATEGSTVQLATCTGQTSQQWQLVYPRSVIGSASGDALALYNPGSGMCLNDPGSSTTNGTQQTVWPCDGSGGQEWTLPGGPVQSDIPGKCLDDYKNLTTNGNKVDEYSCNGAKAQIWTAHTDGTVRHDGKCLNVSGGGTASGTLVNLYSCNGSSAQVWRLTAIGGGVMLQNPHSGLCLTDPADSTVNGTQLQIGACSRTDPGDNWRVS